MPMPIIGETSTYKVTDSLRQLWQKTQGLPALVTGLQGDVTTLQGDVTTLQSDVTTLQGDVTGLQGDVAALQAQKAAFSAHKNGTNQTGVASGTVTQVAWPTELYDIGPHFASNVWTPPAGLVTLSAGVQASGTMDTGATFRLSITKNGATTIFKQAQSGADNDDVAGGMISMQDRASGTDVYGVSIQGFTTAGTLTVLGAATQTWFMGAWLGP